MKLFLCIGVLALLSLSQAMRTPQNILRFEQEVGDVTCPNRSTCPDRNTCCPTQDGGYACCPMRHATCCSDKLHCCPGEYTCDINHGTCYTGRVVFRWTPTTSPNPPLVRDVTCPDQSSCPDGNTCCQDQQGGYACCPLLEATCCSDNLHCCPNGYRCDVSAGRCYKGNDILTWLTKQPSKPAPVKDVTCPDQSSCPDGNTCCQDQQEGYACCPLPEATCCSDNLHCCPNGYRCDVSAGRCYKGNDILTWLTKQPSKPSPVKEVICPDQSSCPDKNTCCQDQQGGYACCPLPEATCCSDDIHCCPNGYTCDVSAGRCNRGEEFVEWLIKRAAKPAPFQH